MSMEWSRYWEKLMVSILRLVRVTISKGETYVETSQTFTVGVEGLVVESDKLLCSKDQMLTMSLCIMHVIHFMGRCEVCIIG